MALISCPARLEKLIKRVNKHPQNENDPLRRIARAFTGKRLGKRRANQITVTDQSQISVSLISGRVTLTNELALALIEIESPQNIALIRECAVPACAVVFWAGRSDKEACDTHVSTWRKQKQRRRLAEREKKAAKLKQSRRAERLRFTKISDTAWEVIVAIMNQRRVFSNIDHYVARALRFKGKRPTTRKAVRDCLDMLVSREYLDTYPHEPDDPEFEERDPEQDRWAPTQKLINQLRGVKRPTH
jgi:hypothetical protein